MAERSRVSRAARRRGLTRIINPRAVLRAVYLVPRHLCDYNFSPLTSYLPSPPPLVAPRSARRPGRVAGWPHERKQHLRSRSHTRGVNRRICTRASTYARYRSVLYERASRSAGGFRDTAAEREGSIGDVIGAGNRAGFRLHRAGRIPVAASLRLRWRCSVSQDAELPGPVGSRDFRHAGRVIEPSERG